MPAWAWWGLISLGLCGLSCLDGRFSRPHAPAGNGPWEPSWTVYFSPNGGALQASRERTRGAQRTILVHAYLSSSQQIAGALVRAHQRGVQVQVLLDAQAQPHPRRCSRMPRRSWQRCCTRSVDNYPETTTEPQKKGLSVDSPSQDLTDVR